MGSCKIQPGMMLHIRHDGRKGSSIYGYNLQWVNAKNSTLEANWIHLELEIKTALFLHATWRYTAKKGRRVSWPLYQSHLVAGSCLTRIDEVADVPSKSSQWCCRFLQVSLCCWRELLRWWSNPNPCWHEWSDDPWSDAPCHEFLKCPRKNKNPRS